MQLVVSQRLLIESVHSGSEARHSSLLKKVLF